MPITELRIKHSRTPKGILCLAGAIEHQVTIDGDAGKIVNRLIRFLHDENRLDTKALLALLPGFSLAARDPHQIAAEKRRRDKIVSTPRKSAKATKPKPAKTDGRKGRKIHRRTNAEIIAETEARVRAELTQGRAALPMTVAD